MDFSKKVVLITGASSGIGEATAHVMAELGAELALVARNLVNLKRVASQCQKPNGNLPLVISADVTKEKDIIKIEKEVIKHYGRVDVLLNIAGAVVLETILKPDTEKFDKNIALNLRSVYLMTARFVPHLIKSQGNIVNVSSISSEIMVLGHCGYNVSKSGVSCLTQYSAAELARKGVRVNCVKPGLTKTRNLFEFKIFGLSLTQQHTEELNHKLAMKMPMGRLILPREIGEVIAFLASDMASSITGVCFRIDGGQYLMGSSVATESK